MSKLFEDVRSEQNLFSAWRHVKRSALNSKDNQIRGSAAEFEHRHQRYLRTIATQLRNDRFTFDKVKGVLKDKKKRIAAKKNPRPIAVATLRNRVVQRAILQVLQPRKARNEKDVDTRFEPIEDSRLGNLNLVNRSRYGVGGLMRPFGGVRPAIDLAMIAMSNGASHYYQSDIKEFFTQIPTDRVVEKVLSETGDAALSDLFANALEVHLDNEGELLKYANLFPKGGIGVAQGSSLSAFAGNVLLYNFDHELNRKGVSAVRYIDDLLILANKPSELEAAIEFSKRELGAFNFKLYPPDKGSDKASQGRCENSFKFLGCTLQPNRCVPSKQSIDSLITEVNDTISKSKSAIKRHIENGERLDPAMSRSAVLHKLGRKIFGWQKSFSFCSDASEFLRLDATISARISDYENWLKARLTRVDATNLMEVLGIPNTTSMFNEARKSLAERKIASQTN